MQGFDIGEVNNLFFIGVVFSNYPVEYENIALTYVTKAKEQLELSRFSSEKLFEDTIGDMLKRCYQSLITIATAKISRNETDSAISILQTLQDPEASAKLGEIYKTQAEAEQNPDKAEPLITLVSLI